MTNQNSASNPTPITKLRSTTFQTVLAGGPAGTKFGVLLVSIGECQKPKTKKATIDGATTFKSKVVMVSLTMPLARK